MARKRAKISKKVQSQYRSQGQQAGGTEPIQFEHLVTPETPEALSNPQSYNEKQCDAILVVQTDIGTDEMMKIDARRALMNGIQTEELYVEHEVSTTVGNLRGLSFASMFHQVRVLQGQASIHDSEIAELKGKITTLDAKNAVYGSDIVSLQERVSGLRLSLNAYKLLRHRFIGTFKRDKQGNETPFDIEMIAQGNQWAHGGDAMMDCQLYQGIRPRNDPHDFEQLYGFPPQVVERLTRQETISALNTYATIRASDRKYGTEKFYQSFATFADLFKKSECDESYLYGNETPVTTACMEFLKCSKNEVRWIQEVEEPRTDEAVLQAR